MGNNLDSFYNKRTKQTKNLKKPRPALSLFFFVAFR
jgi:hypothetical protein